MNALCAVLVGLAAGWCAPAVVAQWIGTADISMRLVGAATCAALFAVATTFEAGEAFAALAYWSLCLALVDYSCRRLPNALTLPGAAAVMVSAVWGGLGSAALVGGLMLGLLYLVGYVTSGGVGAGDVKLAVPLGAVAATSGGSAWCAAAFLAPVGTAALALAVHPFGGARHPVPHGPSMCAATLVASVTFAA
ncbi:hypothetical protein GCM10007304_24060 [Rhodococcoides trifolii]|uniref:Prepilin type IV endopeptidase peptidase domain-containing protein n=1 Tax=Rhodococcoides trifolii TaxID=908250 RepID=A0A917D563_9NOCA|nr:A24 family peptidase [Rhodococcus trifolii]GGG09153.1 hypothetical protein GCM10007304_24060 [Rhodococcus trifolii]